MQSDVYFCICDICLPLRLFTNGFSSPSSIFISLYGWSKRTPCFCLLSINGFQFLHEFILIFFFFFLCQSTFSLFLPSLNFSPPHTTHFFSYSISRHFLMLLEICQRLKVLRLIHCNKLQLSSSVRGQEIKIYLFVMSRWRPHH